MKENIVNLLYEYFASVYCDNCKFNFNNEDNGCDPCDNCHRKYMNWSISNESSDYLADEIIKIVQKVD